MVTISENTPMRSRESLWTDKSGAQLVLGRALKSMAKYRFSSEKIQAAYTAVSHAVTNAFIHGYGNNPTQNIFFEYSVTNAIAVFTIKDKGRGFHPHGNYPKNSGLARMHRLPNFIFIDSCAHGTIVTMRFEKPTEKEAQEAASSRPRSSFT